MSPLLPRDFLKNEVNYVESSHFHLLIVVFGHHSPVLSICFKASSLTLSIRSRLLLSSWWFLCSSYALTWMFISPTPTSMTTSVPNVSLNGVSPVGTLVVILYAHRTLGSSSYHARFAPSNQVLIILADFCLSLLFDH